MSEYGVLLNGAYLSGGNGGNDLGCAPLDPIGCLTEPPDGMGLPALRTEDVVYQGRDGVRHFADHYEPRILTFVGTISAPGCAGACPEARERAQTLLKAWSRQCDDVELVLYTDCHGQGPTDVVGPFGIIGRPRVATVKWRPGRAKVADVVLRFDAVDHRMYVLDECGTPGSGTVCTVLQTNPSSGGTRCYPRCYTPTWCYTSGEDPGTGTAVTVTGTECVASTITLCGRLTNPVVENLTTGEEVGYAGVIPAGECVIIDTATGTATTDDGADRTYALTGNPRMQLVNGVNELRLRSFASDDNGTAEICFRPQTVSA